MNSEVRYIPAGDQYIIIEFGNAISEGIHKMVRELFLTLQQKSYIEIIEMIPSYRSLLIQYNPMLTTVEKMVDKIKEAEIHSEAGKIPAPRIITIPVLYGGKDGPDLEFVASYHHMKAEDVTAFHCSRDYLVYMLGFTPGFCYLGGMDERIATPRLEEPRTLIPAGSVGIAGNQTGIYPIDSPGGWQLIGRTPLRLFDPYHETRPVLLEAGDYIRYQAISPKEYDDIKKRVDENRYEAEIIK